jgi:lipoprotein-anchoring transpeptidase ErfK/SrfK
VRSRAFVVVAIVLACLFVGAGAVLAYDSSQSHAIAKGIKIGGVNVGGLSVANARARLRSAYHARLSQPIVVRFARRQWSLSPRQVQLAIDVNSSVQKALDRTRSANLVSRVFRSLTGGTINANIDPQLTYSRQAVGSFVQGIARSVDRPVREATIHYTGDSVTPVPGASGLAVRTQALTRQIQDVLDHGAARRHLPVPVVQTQPRITTSQYPTIITIDRSAFTLRLWKHLKLAKSYTIAVGQAGLETPAGLHFVIDKEVDPPWHVPNSSWAGSLAGQTIPPGPQDPLKARWIGFYDGDGIHGTDDTSSLGSAASHGCIRMSISDVVQLYAQVPMGSPVFVA